MKITIAVIISGYSFLAIPALCQFGSYLPRFSPGRFSFGVPFKLSVLSSFALLTEPGVAASNLFGGVVSGKIYVFVN